MKFYSSLYKLFYFFSSCKIRYLKFAVCVFKYNNIIERGLYHEDIIGLEPITLFR